MCQYTMSASPVTWLVVHVPIQIDFAGVSITEYTLVRGTFSSLKKPDKLEARECELAIFNQRRRAVVMLSPVLDEK